MAVSITHTHIGQHFDEGPSEVTILVLLEEGCGQAFVPNAPRTSNTVHILLNVAGEIIVDDMLDHGDIQASCCY